MCRYESQCNSYELDKCHCSPELCPFFLYFSEEEHKQERYLSRALERIYEQAERKELSDSQFTE